MREFIRRWTLAISMMAGASSYFILSWLPLGGGMRRWLLQGVGVVQPVLIFLMLFLTFCRVNPAQMRLCRWQMWNLLLQAGMFALLCLVLVLFPLTPLRPVIEGALLCFICPTATAAVVVTSKLGGRAGTTTAYTLLINLGVAILVPLLVPLAHPQAGMGFAHAFSMILSKVFPLLLCPIVAAELLRRLSPGLIPRSALPPVGGGIGSGSGSHHTQSGHEPRIAGSGRWDSPGLAAGLHHTVCRGPTGWPQIRRPDKRCTIMRTEEHGICHLDGLHLPHACHSPGRRFLQHLAQRI